MLDCARILVTLETDPTRYHGEKARFPAQPDFASCEQILAHIVADLEKIFPAIRDFSIAMPGALYDQTQILQPGFPVFAAIETALSAKGRPEPVTMALAIDESDHESGVPAPDPGIAPGLLQNLPLIVAGEGDQLAAMADAMEHRFLEEGQLSAHSAKALEAQFGVALQHARFMTLTDLRALLKLQLEHFGFPGLWTLLDSALERSDEPAAVTGHGGQAFEYADGHVSARFESFDFWARHGAGQAIEDPNKQVNGYVEWTREYRQFITTLHAHGVTVEQKPASPDCTEVAGDYLIEESGNTQHSEGAVEVTEHGTDEVGVIAVTILESGRQFNYYPLTPTGLNTMHRTILDRGLGPSGFSFPGRIIHDPHTRRLLPDTQG